MDYERLGFGLGIFSIGLGLAELAGKSRIARWLGVERRTAERIIAFFGVRKLAVTGLNAQLVTFAARFIANACWLANIRR